MNNNLETEKMCVCMPDVSHQRRGFIRHFTTLGAGLAVAGVPGLWQVAHAGGHTEALLLSCMDYRLMADVQRYMTGRGLKGQYDHVVLAGASLGALTDKFPAWGQTFWDHLEVAINLHHIQRVIVLDHRDCGAYKVIIGKEHLACAETERQTHAEKLRILQGKIKDKYPSLEVEILLMALNGSVEVIST